MKKFISINFKIIITILLVVIFLTLFFGFYYSSPMFKNRIDNIGLTIKEENLGTLSYDCSENLAGGLMGYEAKLTRIKEYRFGFLISNILFVNSRPAGYENCTCSFLKTTTGDLMDCPPKESIH